MDLDAGTVADRLRSGVTRAAALDALEALAPPIPAAVALAAAPALVDVITTETERASYDRCGLLLGRLCVEAASDPAAVIGEAMGGDRLAALFGPALLVEALQRASSAEQPLTKADARSYACLWARECPLHVRGWTAVYATTGRTMVEYFGIVSFTPPLRALGCLGLTPVAVSACLQFLSAEPIISQ